jgi:hypothetical protein
MTGRAGDLSRRGFLGAGAIAGVGLTTAACDTGHGAKAASGRSPRERVAQIAENERQGDPGWDIRHQGSAHEIEGFTDRASVLPGETVNLHVSTLAKGFQVNAYRMGWYNGAQARLVWQSEHVNGVRQARPALLGTTNTVTTHWEPSLEIPTKGWPEGAYLLRLDADSGAQRFVPLTIRSASTEGKLVLMNAVGTWQAYNTWGGYDLYNGPGGTADYTNRSRQVSLNRPFDDNGAPLFLVYEQPAIALAEKLGLPLAYITNLDLAAQPDLLQGARALFSLGHDEYWTPEMRQRVTAARDAGTNVAFLGANALFRRIRLTDDSRGVICYKTSYLDDPLYGKNNALVTNDFREPPHPHPENSLTGTLYESNPTTADYTVHQPDHFLFEGTGVVKGSKFPGLVGTEYDRVRGDQNTPRPIEVLAHSPLECRGVRSFHNTAYYTVPSGAAVFNSGTMRWVQSIGGSTSHGLNKAGTRFTTQVTTNLMRAFAAGPAGKAHPATDNLEPLHPYQDDPIAARKDLW